MPKSSLAMKIGTNISSLWAQRSVSTSTNALARSLERLATGKRVNAARDDASALAIGNGLESQVRGLRQGIRNLNDAFGFVQTAESALGSQAELVQRMREVAF